MSSVWKIWVRTHRSSEIGATVSGLVAVIVLIGQACGIASGSRPAGFSDSDQTGTTQEVPWVFSARNEAGSACLRFSANLPPGRNLDPDSGRLSNSQNCTPIDGLEKRGQFQRLAWSASRTQREVSCRRYLTERCCVRDEGCWPFDVDLRG